MNIQELVGRIVTFKPGIEELEVQVDMGCRGRIVSVDTKDLDKEDVRDHIYVVTVDYSEFEEYNRQFERANYYDRDGRPSLTARQAGMYTVTEQIYFTPPEITPFEHYFELLESMEQTLHNRFEQSNETDYVKWLESLVESLTLSIEENKLQRGE